MASQHDIEMAPIVIGPAPSAHEEPHNQSDSGLTPLDIDSQGTEPPQNAFADARPTRRYQALLLLSGFMMIFHVIGINQIFGVFQVSALIRRHTVRLESVYMTLSLGFFWLGILYLVKEQHSGRGRSGCIGLARWHHRCGSDVGGEYLREPMDGAHPGRPDYHRPRGHLDEPRYFPRKLQHQGG